MSSVAQIKPDQVKNTDIVLQFYTDVFKNRSVEICDALMAEDYINHSELVENGREPFKAYFKHFYKTFGQSGSDIIKVFEQDDLVCVYATHWAKNKLFTVRFKAMDVYRLEAGKLVEHWDSIQALNGFSQFIFSIKAILKL